MSWVDWLRGLAGRRAPAPVAPLQRPRKGGPAYAKEWVKVLEDNARNDDPASTRTWELQPDPGMLPPPKRKPARPPARPAPPVNPEDSLSWESPENESADDPWGLKQPAQKKAPVRKGVNPYDTGVFNPDWSGRFDRR